MEDLRIIPCSCGQDSHIVLKDALDPRDGNVKPTWCYEVQKHGNGEPCEGKCFNCRAPLKDDELFPAVVESAEAPEPVVVDEPADEPRASMSMTKDELLGIAEAMAIEVPAKAKKADIIELIEQAPEDE